MSYLYVGQDYVGQVDKYQSTPVGNPTGSTSGSNGINWPWDPKGNTPYFPVDWNSPNAAKQAEEAYEKIIDYLKNNPGCFNGYLMLLQMTVEIGQHLSGMKPADQAELKKFLAHALPANLMEQIVDMAFQASAVSQKDGALGLKSAQAFLSALASAVGPLQGDGSVFAQIYQRAQEDEQNVGAWVQKHWKAIPNVDGSAWIHVWVDHDGNPIGGNGESPFEAFVGMAAFSLGLLLVNNNDSVNGVISELYHDQVEQLVAECKGNPWALLVALMNLINQRDEDAGQAVNGYGANLGSLKDANAVIEKLLGDLSDISGSGKSGNTAAVADFFSNLQKLKTMVEGNPALNKLVNQLQSDLKTITGQTVTPGEYTGYNGYTWNVNEGIYHFPPGSTVFINGICTVVPSNGLIYINADNTEIKYDVADNQGKPLTMGQLAAMGDFNDIARTMGNWSSTLMSSFENGVTGLQTLVNGASPAIQQELQMTTQTMQARENFEKQIYNSITSMNQQVMRMIQQVMG